MMQRLMPKITPIHVWMYRALGGRIVNQATGGAPALLVTTIGRRSGLSRTVVVGYLPDGDDVIVAGTNGGLPALPSWVLNLRANPEAEVELGQERFSARAEWLEGSELEDHWQRFVTGYPPYEQARQWAGREVPLIRLRRVESAAE
jgi:deazaflavin-dependent oxidoreductase (nitroreductase family)